MTDSRTRIIEASIDLLRARGFAGTGLNDIVGQSGAPKGSLYHHFPSGKNQIVAEALDLYAAQVRSFIEEALSGKKAPARKLEALFEAFATRAEQSGFSRSCAVGTVSLDLGADDEDLHRRAQAALGLWQDTIARHLDLGGPKRSHAFAGVVLTCIEGAYVRSRAERHGDAFRQAGQWLKSTLPAA